ncbi:hypothetical protein G6011_03858 [Alternaria panax]|uniref:DUF7820 domain-containing protein n=1 Tax=Alternaria panax TaxID=48097 RepID=A0AAD4NTG1_9PLEO|nr:hypothetical protein G6011_03858 [Alternaria panax]
MRLPHRSINSIQPLPSIYTTFPSNYDSSQSTDTPGINSGTYLLRKIEDGIEAVPLERSNILSAPILSPDQEEKEVFVPSCKEIDALEKPLPNLPKCIWHRTSLRQRILALLGIQFLMLLTIGLSLLAVKGRSPTSNQDSSVHFASGGFPNKNATSDIRRGIFVLPIQLPQQQSSACLANDRQMQSWNCATNSTLQLSIIPTPAGDETAIMIAVGSTPSNDSVRRGERIPNIPPLDLLAVADAQNDEYAYHFRTTYDKVILLAEYELSMNGELQAHPSTLGTSFQPGDSLWQCVFNETLLEGYIYVTRATSTASEIANTETAGLPDFPYPVRLVEEWAPSGKTPSCRKMTMRQDGTLDPLSEEIMLRLEDPQGNIATSMSQTTKRTRDRERRQEVRSNHCQCQWMVDG